MESWELNLVRFEFLSRVATEGALPASFSKECYEDVLAFKSRLLAAHQKRTKLDGIEDDPDHLGLTLISISKQGVPEDRFVEVTDDYLRLVERTAVSGVPTGCVRGVGFVWVCLGDHFRSRRLPWVF
jgi:hypothetical protein